jgi:hypothetical protein
MTPQKLLADYEKGRITTTGAVNSLIHLAIGHDPASFVTDVPEEWLAELREMSSRNPPPRTFTLASVCNAEPFDPEEEATREKAARERYVAGLKTWKAYFDAQTASPEGATGNSQG